MSKLTKIEGVVIGNNFKYKGIGCTFFEDGYFYTEVSPYGEHPRKPALTYIYTLAGDLIFAHFCVGDNSLTVESNGEYIVITNSQVLGIYKLSELKPIIKESVRWDPHSPVISFVACAPIVSLELNNLIYDKSVYVVAMEDSFYCYANSLDHRFLLQYNYRGELIDIRTSRSVPDSIIRHQDMIVSMYRYETSYNYFVRIENAECLGDSPVPSSSEIQQSIKYVTDYQQYCQVAHLYTIKKTYQSIMIPDGVSLTDSELISDHNLIIVDRGEPTVRLPILYLDAYIVYARDNIIYTTCINSGDGLIKKWVV